MSNLNYGNFSKNEYSTSFDLKIDNEESLSKKDKLLLGKELEKISLTGIFRDLLQSASEPTRESCLIDLAEKYIDLRQRVKKVSPDSSPAELQSRANSETDSLSPDPMTLLDDILKTIDDDEQEKGQEKCIENTFHNSVTHSSVEKAAAKSLEKMAHRMEVLFGLHVLPDVPKEDTKIHDELFEPDEFGYLYKNYNTLKKGLMHNQLPPEQADRLILQAKKFPIMQAAVEKIRNNFMKWDDLALTSDRAGMKELVATLEKQFKNLSVLSDIISRLTISAEDTQAFSALSMGYTVPVQIGPEYIQAGFESHIKIFLEGTVELTESNARQVEAILKYYTDQCKLEMPPRKTSAELRQQGQALPITSRAIQLQAELQQAIRKGKGWAMTEHDLVPIGNSVNEVFKLREAGGTEATAFFKVGAGNEKSTRIMEKLMWDIALLMGLEEKFVPTGMTEIVTYDDFTSKTVVRPIDEAAASRDDEKIGSTGMRQNWSAKKLEEESATKKTIWGTDGGLYEAKGMNEGRLGGIQPAQKGITLHDYLYGDPKLRTVLLNKSEIAGGLLASLVFGMFDAHAKNIFVSEDGKIKFFDNTRNMPNANGFIERGGYLVSAFRCALLNLPETLQPFNVDEITKLKQEVARLKEKFSADLVDFLTSKQTQAQLEKLPPGWMNVEKALSAMGDRINRLEHALNEGYVIMLQDMILETLPGYKFAVAVAYLNRLDAGDMKPDENPESVQKVIHTHVGYSHIDDEMKALAKKGYDLQMIKALCDRPFSVMNDLIETVQKHYTETTSHPSIVSVRDARNKGTMALLADLERIAEPDYKDWNRKDSTLHSQYYNLKAFAALGVKKSSATDLTRIAYKAAIERVDIQLFQEGTEFKVLYNTSTGYRVKNVDIQSIPGMVIADGEKFSIENFIYSLKNFEKPPAYEELPYIEMKFSLALMANSRKPGEIMLRKSQDNRSLVVTHYYGADPLEIKFAPGTNGKFLVYGVEKTIKEIIDQFKKA